MTPDSTLRPSIRQTFRLIAVRLCAAVVLCGTATLPAAAQEPLHAQQPQPDSSTAPAAPVLSLDASTPPPDAPATPDDPTPASPDAASEPSAPTDATPEPALPQPVRVSPCGHITGHIWRMNPGLVFLRTPIGLLTLSCKTCLRDLKGNPTIAIDVQGPHGAVTITAHGNPRPAHLYLWGPLPTGAAGSAASLTRWTPDGEQSFTTDRIAARLAAAPTGQPVTVEAANGALTGVHDLHIDLQISQLPPPGSSATLHMNGPVTKVKNGYAHVQTNLGDIPVSAKLGLCAAKNQCVVKVGDQLSITVQESTAAIDLTSGGASAPTTRIVVAKLRYTGPDKQTLSLRTPTGDTTVAADHARGALAGLKEGAPIIVEFDGDGAVRDIRKGP